MKTSNHVDKPCAECGQLMIGVHRLRKRCFSCDWEIHKTKCRNRYRKNLSVERVIELERLESL